MLQTLNLNGTSTSFVWVKSHIRLQNIEKADEFTKVEGSFDVNKALYNFLTGIGKGSRARKEKKNSV